jgi:hypothetical protein
MVWHAKTRTSERKFFFYLRIYGKLTGLSNRVIHGFKSVVEDNNVAEDECKDFDAYNEVLVADIEQCFFTYEYMEN